MRINIKICAISSTAVGLAILLLTPLAAGQTVADACTGLTCSNHGTCVVKAGEPVCACDDGYVPDTTTGLSCQPVAPLPAAAPTSVAPVYSSTTPSVNANQPLSDGWALGGAIVGYVFAPITVGLPLLATNWVNTENDTPVYVIAGTFLLSFAAAAPISFAGGKSARNKAEGINGVVAMRVIGWVFYGVQLFHAVTMMGLGVSGIEFSAASVGTLGITGMLSLLSFATDAVITRRQVKDANAVRALASTERRRAVVKPAIGACQTIVGGRIPVFGVAASF